jgi:hypothetical protein
MALSTRLCLCNAAPARLGEVCHRVGGNPRVFTLFNFLQGQSQAALEATALGLNATEQHEQAELAITEDRKGAKRHVN